MGFREPRIWLAFKAKRRDETKRKKYRQKREVPGPGPWGTSKYRDLGDEKEQAEETENKQRARGSEGWEERMC